MAESWTNLDITSVLTAGEFYIREAPNESESSQNFNTFNKSLNDHFWERYENGFLSRIGAFKPQQPVITLYEDKWCRGIVHEKRPSKEKCDYQLYLSDYGVYVTLPETNIYALPSSSFSDEPHFAKKVKLGHIVPVSMASELVGCKLIITSDERFRWDSSATVFVKNIKRLSSMNKFTSEAEVDGSYVGEFIVCVTPKLRRFLQETRPNHIFKSHENLADLLVLFEFGKRREELLPVPNPSKSKTLSKDKSNDSGKGSSTKSSDSSSSSDKDETREGQGRLPALQNILNGGKEIYKSPATPESEEDLWSPFTRKFDSLNNSAYQRLTNASPIAVLRKRTDSNVVYNDFCELPEPRFRFPSTDILARRLADDNFEISSDPEGTEKPKYKGKDVQLCAPENFGDFWASRCLDVTRLIRVYNHGALAATKNELMTNLWDLKSIANSSVYDSLEARKFLPCDLQLVMWPTVIRGRSCVAIDRNKSVGKTMGYIAPLMSQILDSHQILSTLKHKETGPLAIVICSTSVRVVDVAEEMEKLIGENEIKIVTMYAGCSPDAEKHTRFRLSIGAHVLVTTMQSLERVGVTSVVPFEKDLTRYISLERCFHLVYDDIEDIMKISPKKPITLLEMWIETISHTHQLPKQFVGTANGWNREIQEIMPLIEDLQPSIIIPSALDAVIYSSLPTTTHFITEENMHFQAVIDIVSENKKKNKKILIFVEDSCQAAYMQKLLRTIAVAADYINSDYHHAITEVLCSWYGDSSAVCLVAADCVDALLDHDLRDANIVIHLTPPRSCHDFSRRYSFMLDHFPHTGDSEVTCQSHVILSEDIISSCPRLVNELKSLKADMDPSVEPLNVKALEAIEEKRNYRSLCGLWKSFGRCENSCCTFRHVPDAGDVHDHLPLSGEISFDIITVLSPIRFTIKIKQYKDPETSKIFTFDKYYNSMFSFLQWYFIDSTNKRVIQNPSVGMLCALKGSHSWVRGDIQEIQTDGKVVKCKVFLLDEGTCHLKALNSLYELPEECSTMPALVNEVFISNVKPVDLSTEFTPYANQFITQKIKKSDPTSYKGRVVMSLENTIWLSPTLQMTQIGTTTISESLRNILLENDLGTEDKEHLELMKDTRDRLFKKFDWMLNYEASYEKLIANCPKVTRQTTNDSNSHVFDDLGYEEEKATSASRVTSPKKTRSNVFSLLKSLPLKRPPSLQYCRLPLHQNVLVEVSRIVTPNEFFMVMLPNDDKIHQLRGEISKVIGSCIPLSKRSSSQFYLAPGRNGEFQRCRISLKGSVESECYFIDTGLLSTVCNNAILECPSRVVECLEAQAIQGSLCVDFSEHGDHSSFTMNLLVLAEPNWSVKAIHEEIVSGQPKYKVELFSGSDVSTNGISAILMDAIKDLPAPRYLPSPTRTIKDFMSRYSSKASSEVGEETSSVLSKMDNPFARLVTGRAHSKSKSSESKVPQTSIPSTATTTVTPPRLSFGRGRPIEKPQREVGSCANSLVSSVSQKSPGRPFSNDVQTRIKTFWSQTQTDLTIKFFVGYKGEFEHKIGRSWVYASVTLNNELFTVNEDLYANVDCASLRIRRNNKFMVFHFKKCIKGKWPRLISKTESQPWLKVDETDLTSSDESLAYRPPPLPVTKPGEVKHHQHVGGRPDLNTSCESLESDGSSIYRHF